MTDYEFVPAVRSPEWARIALTGPPGSGTTPAALALATALDPQYPVGVLDTTGGAVERYADRFAFSVLPMGSFEPEELTAALAWAQRQGIRNLVVDTATAFWSDEGGLLDQVAVAAEAAPRGAPSGAGWNVSRPRERAARWALLNFGGHVITTWRTRVDVQAEADPAGRIRPRRIGTRPDGPDGYEYDYQVAGLLDGGVLTLTRSDCPDLPVGQVIEHPGTALAQTLSAWLAEPPGDRFDPTHEAKWATDNARTVAELEQWWAWLAGHRRTGAVVLDKADRMLTIADVYRLALERARARARAAEAAAASRAAPTSPAVGGPVPVGDEVPA